MTYFVPAKIADSWLVTEFDRPASTTKNDPTVAQLRKRWKTTTSSNQDHHQASAAIAMTLADRITRLLYDKLLAELAS
jgi:hypothetical protein